MAAAMARGWAAGDGGPREMVFCDLDAERASQLASDVGGSTAESLAELRDGSDALLLAVKPAALGAVARELGGEAPPILSVMAATSIADLRAAFPGVPILRVMPNQPVEVRRGVICHPPPTDGAEHLVELLAPLGKTYELAEGMIEPAMAVMSCAPAYSALFAKSLADAGADEGLDPVVSLSLVAETMAGTALLLESREPGELIAAVAPPGGATEKGLEALSDGGMPESIKAAVEASLERFR
jgi:pyrroline-5-carboxylate reductase